MVDATDDADLRNLIARRAELLDLLATDPRSKRDIIASLDTSRSTVDRAIRRLEEHGLVERVDGGYLTTLTGRMALERFREYAETLSAVAGARDLFSPLPVETAISARAIKGAEITLATAPTPYKPAERIYDAVEEATRYRALLPSLDDPRHLRLCYENVVTEGREVMFVLPRNLLTSLQDEFPQRLAHMAEADSFQAFVGDVPQYGLLLTEASDEMETHIVVYSETGGVHGCASNPTAEARAWAVEQFDRCRTEATNATARLHRDDESYADGGSATAVAHGATLPHPLDRQGFVRLSKDYFAGRATTDPVISWRAGLSLADVQAGAAVRRTIERDGETLDLANWLVDRLRSGSDTALLGAPGSGKSTVCRQVACRWYRADIGPVFYHRSDAGHRFEAVDEFASTLEESAGHTLVVVEDVLRPSAREVLEVVREHATSDDVTFLLDSRTAEWHDPPGGTVDPALRSALVENLETVSMPSLAEADFEQFVEHLDRTLDRSVDVPVDRLREGLELGGDPKPGRDRSTPVDVLLLAHRAALYADPLADAATTLEEDVRAVYDDLSAAGETALDVGVLVALLTGANRPVRPATIAGAFTERSDEAIRESLARLEGRVVFPDPEVDRQPPAEPYETVHETWAVEFLAHLLECDDGEAAARFGRCLSAYLEIADEPGRLDDPRGADDSAVPTRDWSAWAADAVEQVFDLGLRIPRLAPLFGTAQENNIQLPDVASAEMPLRLGRWRARMYANGGDFEAAEREYRALLDAVRSTDSVPPDTAREYEAFGLTYLGRALTMQGDRDEAEAIVRRALDEFDLGPLERGNCHHNLALVAYYGGDLEPAREHVLEAIELRRNAGAKRLTASSLQLRGTIHRVAWNYDEAAADLREALSISRETDYAFMEALCLYGLGELDRLCGPFDRAEARFRECLEISRTIGYVDGQIHGYEGLGHVATYRGNFEVALGHFDEMERLANGKSGGLYDMFKAVIEEGRGLVARRRGNLTAARSRFEAASAHTDDGFPFEVADMDVHLATVAIDEGRFDEAEALIETWREEIADRGDVRLGSVIHRNAGRIAAGRDNYRRAEQEYSRSLDLADRAESSYERARTLVSYATLALDRDHLETARDRYVEAIELLHDCGAYREAIDAIESLIEVCEALDDGSTVADWRRRAVRIDEEASFDPGYEEFLAECRSAVDRSPP